MWQAASYIFETRIKIDKLQNLSESRYHTNFNTKKRQKIEKKLFFKSKHGSSEHESESTSSQNLAR